MWRALETDPRVPGRTVGRAVEPKPPVRDDVRAPVPKPEPTGQIVGPATAMVKLPGLPAPLTPQSVGERSYVVEVTIGEPDPSLRMSQPRIAVPGLLGAAETDPLRAALDAVYVAVATYGEDYRTLLQEIWSACRDVPS